MSGPRKSIDDVGDVASGYDTARVTSDLDPDEAARRARQHADARGIIAAHVFERFGVDVTAEVRGKHPASLLARLAVKEFAELAAMLGLDAEPQRPPGVCLCGKPLPVTVATPSKTTDYKHGMCWACSHGTTAKPRDEPPPVPEPTAFRGGQGHCAHCDRRYMLDGEGRLRYHPGWETRPGRVRVRLAEDCAGSGGYPSRDGG